MDKKLNEDDVLDGGANEESTNEEDMDALDGIKKKKPSQDDLFADDNDDDLWENDVTGADDFSDEDDDEDL